MKLFIGLMSGTSMDGIDAALLDVDTNTLIAGITRAYNEKTRHFLESVLDGTKTGLGVISQLNTLVGMDFAQAVLDLLEVANISSEQVEAIGSHGQTICHDASSDIPYTVQLGCAHTIAELTGITVIADFRTRDLVVGGHGAPFAPAYHQALFGKLDYPLAVVNIGGIANITYLEQGISVSGHDTGPGNCLMDTWIQKQLGKTYDANGAWAEAGTVIMPLLTSLLADPYFKRASPKSIGKEYFSYTWLSNHLMADYAIQDVQATLLALTATTIAQAVNTSPIMPRRVALCGGGAHNRALHKALIQQLPSVQVESTESMGVNPDFLEAMMFAWLAEKTLNQIPVDLTRITAARKSAILGAIYHVERKIHS